MDDGHRTLDKFSSFGLRIKTGPETKTNIIAVLLNTVVYEMVRNEIIVQGRYSVEQYCFMTVYIVT